MPVSVRFGPYTIVSARGGHYDLKKDHIIIKGPRAGTTEPRVVSRNLTLERACQQLIDLWPHEHDVATLAELRDSILDIRSRLAAFLIFRDPA